MAAAHAMMAFAQNAFSECSPPGGPLRCFLPSFNVGKIMPDGCEMCLGFLYDCLGSLLLAIRSQSHILRKHKLTQSFIIRWCIKIPLGETSDNTVISHEVLENSSCLWLDKGCRLNVKKGFFKQSAVHSNAVNSAALASVCLPFHFPQLLRRCCCWRTYSSCRAEPRATIPHPTKVQSYTRYSTGDPKMSLDTNLTLSTLFSPAWKINVMVCV